MENKERIVDCVDCCDMCNTSYTSCDKDNCPLPKTHVRGCQILHSCAVSTNQSGTKTQNTGGRTKWKANIVQLLMHMFAKTELGKAWNGLQRKKDETDQS